VVGVGDWQTHDKRLLSVPFFGRRFLLRFYCSSGMLICFRRARLVPIATALREARARGADAWCILDNTTLGAATGNALLLTELLAAPGE